MRPRITVDLFSHGDLTACQRRRLMRDAATAVLYRHGFSTRLIAVIFDVTHRSVRKSLNRTELPRLAD